MIEEWKDVEGFEGLYQISNCGRVKSLNYHRSGKEKILKFLNSSNGYLNVILCKDGKRKMFLIHRLVAQAFLPNPNGYEEVNHKDENPSNNCVSNLEYCDHHYNMNYGTAIERMSEKLTNRTDLSKPVLQIDKDTNEIIREWPSVMEVQRQLGYSKGYISDCCLGKHNRNTAYGYKWNFA